MQRGKRTPLPKIDKSRGLPGIPPVEIDPAVIQNLTITPEQPKVKAVVPKPTPPTMETPRNAMPAEGPLFGALSQAQDLMAGGWGQQQTPLTFDYLSPASQPTDVIDRVKPIPTRAYDWRTRADSWAGRLFAPEEGDDLPSITKKMEARRKFSEQLEALDGQLTPGDVDAIALHYYDSLVPPTPAFASFSPDQQQLLSEAYTSNVPGARIASARDVDPNQAAALGAYALVGLLTGKSNFGDALRGVSLLMNNTQNRLNMERAQALEQDGLRREHVLARFKRLSEIDDFNAQQQGYQAKGDRDTERQMLTQGMIADRQAEATAARQYAADRNLVLQAIATGDPNRIVPLVEAFEDAYPDQPLPESARRLSPTINQRLTLAKVDETKASIGRITAMAEGLRFDNELNRRTFNDQVKFIQEKGRLEDLKADMLEQELKFLPDTHKAKLANWWADRRYKLAMINIRAQEAQARLISARNAGSKDGSDKDYVSTLKSLVNGFNTSIDNKSREYARAEGEVATLENLKLNQQAVNENADTRVIDGQIRAKRKQMEDLEKDLDGEQRKVNEYLDLIDKTIKGGK